MDGRGKFKDQNPKIKENSNSKLQKFRSRKEPGRDCPAVLERMDCWLISPWRRF
jgi:hypothetical protein